MTISDEIYQEILANGPSSGTFVIILSKLKEAGQHNKVIQECIRAIKTYPQDIPIRRLLAEAYLESGLLAQAEAELDEIISRIDTLAPLYKLQAHIYHKEKRDPEAIKSLGIYLAHRPDDQEALRLLETLSLSQAAPRALPPSFAEAREPVESVPDLPPEPRLEMKEETARIIEEEGLRELATPTLAEVYVNQGQVDEAINLYERILVQNPDDKGSEQRVQELKAMMALKKPMGAQPAEEARQRKEKMIATLEIWLEEMRKMPKDSMPA